MPVTIEITGNQVRNLFLQRDSSGSSIALVTTINHSRNKEGPMPMPREHTVTHSSRR